MLQLLLTLAVGGAGGLLFFKLKVPGGMMVGALVAVTILSIGSGLSYMPSAARVAAQIAAGAFIGTTVEKSDLKRLPHLIRPAALLLCAMLCLNLIMGLVFQALGGVVWLPAFLCAVPGGMSDTPIIAADMGAKAGDVALAQFMRLVAGIGVFPSLILRVTRNEPVPRREGADRVVTKRTDVGSVLLTLAVAAACGVTGKLLGVPVGALLFSMLGVIVLKLTVNRVAMPLWLKRVAQVLSGAYIGSSLGMEDLLDMRVLLLPIVLLVLGYGIVSFLVGGLLHRFFGFTLREGMLIATPAGANDMALISGDLDVHSPDVVVLQIVRMVIVISLFPQLIHLLVGLLP